MPIYRAMKKYGIDSFDISEIEQCSDELLNDREKYWIQYFNSVKDGYNVALGGSGNKKYEDSDYLGPWNAGMSVSEMHKTYNYDRGYTSRRLKELGINQEEINVRRISSQKYHNSSPVYQYGLDGQYIGSFRSVRDAGDICNYKTIYAAAIGNIPSASGYQWRYSKHSKIAPCIKRHSNQPKEVFQYDLDGNYITSFSSAAEASQRLGLEHGNLCSACRGEQKSCGGYQWRYQYFDKINSLVCKDINAKCVNQLDNDGVLISTYSSLTEAAQVTGINRSSISSVCNGRYKTAGGYKWSFGAEEVKCA